MFEWVLERQSWRMKVFLFHYKFLNEWKNEILKEFVSLIEIWTLSSSLFETKNLLLNLFGKAFEFG